MKRVRLIVAPTEAGLTAGALLADRGQLSKVQLDGALAAGGITLNKRRLQKLDALLAHRDELVANLESRGAPASGPRPLDASRILHLDADLVVIDKPPGLAAQGTEVDAAAGLDAAVRALLAARGVHDPFVGLVHRLDIETSGVTLFGRTPEAVRALTAQFREGRIEKRYTALVAGLPTFTDVVADGPIDADHERKGSYRISPRGRVARTDFHVAERFEGHGIAAARIDARPRTGRTHQIRVHAAALGHPMLGDRRYGGPAFVTAPDGTRLEFGRVALHAAELSCEHPAGGLFRIESPWPADLAALEGALRRAAAGAAAQDAARRR